MQVTTFEAERFSFARILSFPRDLVRNGFVISSLVRRELKGRHLNSTLGALWSVVNPLFMIIVYTTVFAVILGVRWEAAGKEIADNPTTFAMMLFCAMTPWLAFQESLTRGSGIILENSNLIKKVAFPSEALPIYVVAYTLVNELIGVAIFMIALPVLGFDIHVTWLWYPLVVAIRLLFTLGMTYIVATANVFVRDVGQMIGLVTTLWMFLTPIFYAREMLENSGAEWVQTGMRFNPWYYIVTMYRDIFIRGVNPDPMAVVTIVGIGLITFVIGYTFFMTSKMKFADEI